MVEIDVDYQNVGEPRVYRLKPHIVLGKEYAQDSSRHIQSTRIRKFLEKMQHRFDLLAEDAPSTIYQHPNTAVYRQQLLHRGIGVLENTIATGPNIGGKERDSFRRSTMKMAKNPRALWAFVCGSEVTWQAVCFQEGTLPPQRIIWATGEASLAK